MLYIDWIEIFFVFPRFNWKNIHLISLLETIITFSLLWNSIMDHCLLKPYTYHCSFGLFSRNTDTVQQDDRKPGLLSLFSYFRDPRLLGHGVFSISVLRGSPCLSSNYCNINSPLNRFKVVQTNRPFNLLSSNRLVYGNRVMYEWSIFYVEIKEYRVIIRETQ